MFFDVEEYKQRDVEGKIKYLDEHIEVAEEGIKGISKNIQEYGKHALSNQERKDLGYWEGKKFAYSQIKESLK